MTWQVGLLGLIGILSSALAMLSSIKLKQVSKQNIILCEKIDKIWEKYAMKCNEVENLKSRINQTINKPYIN